MFIGFIDDSGSTGANLEEKSRFQVIGGPLISSKHYIGIEWMISSALEGLLSEEEWESFEFHASRMFHAQEDPYRKLGQQKCWALMKEVLDLVQGLDIPILYGTVDKRSVSGTVLRDAIDPAGVAFNLYLEALEEWLCSRESQNGAEPGILIVDNAGNRSRVRETITRAFRKTRRKIKSDSSLWDGEKIISLGNSVNPQMRSYPLDDVYFGDSKNSIGLQIADICVYFINRKLHEAPEAKGFYEIIENHFFSHKRFPVQESSA